MSALLTQGAPQKKGANSGLYFTPFLDTIVNIVKYIMG